MGKHVYIETYGCQMNEHDSERMLRLLEGISYSETKEAGEADLILINTCSVREKPEHKVYSALGRFKELKEEKGTIIGVAGCLAQQEGRRLLNRIPYLDMVIGTQAIPALPDLVKKVESSGRRVCETGFDLEEKYLKTVLPLKPQNLIKSYVTVMQGCDHFCSYCIVPHLRGREKSRPSQEVIEEIKHLAGMGIKEVCLLGQNVNGYGKGQEGELNFSRLLHRINEIDGIERIRFTTSHPADLSDELIRSFSELTKLCEHIHLPFQSGSNKILKAMYRRYTKELYLEKIDRLRKGCPSISLTSDVIVGFPGEEEDDFKQTMDLIRRIQFDDLFSFKYSARKGTRAAQYEDRIDEQMKQDRLASLQNIQQEITFQKNQSLIGSVEEILVEGRSKQDGQDVTGRTRSNKIVNVEGDLRLTGELVPVRITRAFPHSLRGERVESNAERGLRNAE